jgi:D-sedoheptulose 7-phosphate isomerase
MSNNGTQQLATVDAYFRRLQAVATQLPFNDLERIIDLLMEGFESGRTIFVFGNGGSAATASHMMCDMNKGTIAEGEKRRFKVLALTDNVPLMTAWANDSSYENIFAEQLRNFARPGDIAFAISGSGNSPNVLLGLRAAREAGATAVGLAGYEGGKMKALCNHCAVVPCDNMQIIEDMHHAALHAMFTVIKGRIESQMRRVLATGAGRLKK